MTAAGERVSMEPRRQALIEDNIALVDHVVRRVASGFPRHVERQELIAAGRLGLTEAAVRFDFDHGGPFAPYAARRIRGAVLDLARSGDWVPRVVRETARRADEVSGSMRSDLGRAPSDSEVATRLRTDATSVREARSAAAHGAVGTLDRSDGDDGAPGDTLADDTVASIEEILENRELHGYLRSALDQLPDRLRLIVIGHYLEGQPLDDLAALLGVTPSRVSQLRSDAVEILRDGLDAQYRDAGSVSATVGETSGVEATAARPKGRVAIRQAQFATAVAENADWRTRLVATKYRALLPPPGRATAGDPPAGSDDEALRHGA